MKWFLSWVLLLIPCTGLWAQDLSDTGATSVPQSVASTAEAVSSGPAFVLDISAPDDIRQLLQRHLELQRYRELSDLSDEELDRLLDMAKTDSQNLVATLGYFSPVILIKRQDADNTKPGRHVSISVVAGEPVQVAQVLVHFSGPITTDPGAAEQRQLIQNSWSLPAGNRFTQDRWDAAKQQALRQLTTRHYPTGTISHTLADIDPVTHQARLEITLDSGQPYQLGGLAISGLQRFDANLVRRLARITEGADYDQAQLAYAQQRLTGSGYFDSAFVSIDTQSDPKAAQVLVTLREARLQKIVLGVGASTDSGARLSAEHLHNLVPGLGWRALSKVSVDRTTQSLSTELTAPPDDNGWRWNTSMLLQSQLSGTYDVGSQRWRAGASQNGEHIDRGYYLQYDRADTAASDASVPVLAESISANYAFTLRNFDALPFPSKGWGFGIELGGGTTLGSTQVPYGRVLTRWQGFYPLGSAGDLATASAVRAGRLALRAQAGAVLAKDGVSLPVTQLFLAGGDTSVRGYGLNDIGIKLADGTVSAGRYLAVGSLEWQRPISFNGALTEWESALFVDAGAVADNPAELQAKVGVGAGVRWKSPVGPLQIDLAYGVATRQFRLHLNVGFAF
jgi:translocation and assembly module TamA